MIVLPSFRIGNATDTRAHATLKGVCMCDEQKLLHDNTLLLTVTIIMCTPMFL